MLAPVNATSVPFTVSEEWDRICKSKLGIILESKVFQKMKLSKNIVLNLYLEEKSIFRKIQMVLEIENLVWFWHFLSKIDLIWYPFLGNLTTDIALKMLAPVNATSVPFTVSEEWDRICKSRPALWLFYTSTHTRVYGTLGKIYKNVLGSKCISTQ